MADEVPACPRIDQGAAQKDQLQNGEDHDGGRCPSWHHPLREWTTRWDDRRWDGDRRRALMPQVSMAGMVRHG